MKRCSISVVTRDKIKTIVRYNYIPIRIKLNFLKNLKIPSADMDVDRLTGTLIHCREECKRVQPLSGNILAIPCKFNIHLTSNIEIPLQDISPSEWKPMFKQKEGQKWL